MGDLMRYRIIGAFEFPIMKNCCVSLIVSFEYELLRIRNMHFSNRKFRLQTPSIARRAGKMIALTCSIFHAMYYSNHLVNQTRSNLLASRKVFDFIIYETRRMPSNKPF